MELFKTQDYYIFRQGEWSLWCNRKTGKLEPKSAWDLTLADDPICVGLIHGIIGKLNRFPDGDPQLLIIESCSLVGYVWNRQPVFKINKIGLLSLGAHEPEITTHPCSKHNNSVAFNQKSEDGLKQISRQQEALAKTWGSIKSATKSLKTSTVQAAHRIGMDGREGERSAKKLTDEVEKMFSQSDSFYFSPTVDLTNSIQISGTKYNTLGKQSWKSANSRFFWNQYLLKELIDLEDPKADAWIVPILHGYIHIDTIPVELDGVMDFNKSLTLLLVSRRSRNRAGTRYKRRGVDENGYVANYVETEQCLLFQGHVLSFVQIRGSVPVFWSQPGFKYRPPPQIDRGVEDTRLAFRRHFERELDIYGNQCVVSLVEQSGKEKIIGDAFTDNIVYLNEPRLTYVTFDFHEHCRGMRFENVGRLVCGLEDVFQEMKYTWIDSHGIIHQQQSTYRVNCMDCLDRTNVCQTAFAKFILEVQLNKLGILPPEGSFWPGLKSAFNIMWANNGDVLSRQYAGTNALKGDFTRTGERRFAGMMKDGMNSANRYYVNRFKDTLKQTAIDMILGHVQPEDAVNLLYGQQNIMEDDEEIVLQTADRVRQVIDDCRKQFVSLEEIVVGSWGLVDAHPETGDPTQVDMDVIVLLSREHLYVVEYDDDSDQVRECRKYSLTDLFKLEVGSEGKTVNTGVNFLKSPKRESSSASSFLMRIHLRNSSEDTEILQFRSTKLRFFNNMAVPICKTEDMNESLKAIAENIHVTMEISGLSIPYLVGTLEKLTKSTNKVRHMEVPLGFPRNSSEGQLSAIKQAGNKALSSVTSHFSRLKPGSMSRNSSVRSTGRKETSPVVASEPVSQSRASTTELRLPSSYSSLVDLSSFSVVKDVLYSCEAGILFLATSETRSDLVPGLMSSHSPTEKCSHAKVLLRCVSAGQFDRHNLPSSKRVGELSQVREKLRLKVTPEILVSSMDGGDQIHPQRGAESSTTNLRLSKHFSHSSECVEPSTDCGGGSGLSIAEPSLARASSETSLGSNQSANELKSSKSEQPGFHIGANVLASFRIPSPQGKFSMSNILTSPISGKGNPLGLLAKGVQNLGSLDPRKKLDHTKRDSSISVGKPKDEEEILCSTRIIRI